MKPSWDVAVALLLLVASPSAEAARRLPTPTDKTMVDQCGSCHMPYPAETLPTRSWRRLMSDLSNHFGEDASMSQEDLTTITNYLVVHAADGPAGGSRRFLRGLSPEATPLRITDTPYWRRRHDEISARRFQDPKVKTAANCAACHNGGRGFLGLFSDDD
jgi:hypothetical protein